MNTKRLQMENYNNQKKGYKKEDQEYKNLEKLIKDLNDEVFARQNQIIQENPGKLVAKIVKMSMDVTIPDAPKDENGKILDSMFRYKYYHDHYFDNFDFSDDRLVRTPIFHTKLAPYFAKESMFQHCDTIIKYAFKLCDKMSDQSETYQYTVSYITSTFEQSKIMNMDKVFVEMADRYYCPKNDQGNPRGFWVPQASLDKICEKAETNRLLVYGKRPPNLILRDTTDVQWRDFYSLKSDYTILYFWDPDCGHCNKVTPKLQTLYAEKLKARNVEVFAVAKAVDKDFQKWKDKISKEGFTFINVAVTASMYNDAMDKTDNQRKLMEMLRYTTLESLNYQQTYDVFSTPRVFVLDKDKKIIAKSLSISQLEDYLDNLQNVKDAVKLFPLEEEDPEEREVH
jgi:thiol-disulfide isomerase/thioredoxin